MPSVDLHVKKSLDRTGKEYREVHEWTDEAPNKGGRHDLTKLLQNAAIIRTKWGEEGAEEYLQHLRDDLEARFEVVADEFKQAVTQTLVYFGVRPGV